MEETGTAQPKVSKDISGAPLAFQMWTVSAGTEFGSRAKIYQCQL